MLIDAPRLSDLVPDEQVAAFARDGATCVRQALSPGWMQVLEDGIERALREMPLVWRGAGRSSGGDDGTNGGRNKPALGEKGVAFEAYRDGAGELYDAKGLWQSVPELQAFVFDSPIVDVIARLIATEEAWVFYDQLLVKNGGDGKPTPFHQDSTVFPYAGMQAASAWIALESLPKQEALAFARGSHLGPMYGYPATGTYIRTDRADPNLGKADLPPFPDIESDPERYEIMSWDIEPGDVVFFNFNTIHGGAPTTNTRRRAYSLRIFGDDVVYEKRGADHLAFPDLAASLNDGDPLRHAVFPKVRPRAKRPD